MSLEGSIFVDLSEKCDRRTKALLKAVDALEEIRGILVKLRRKDDKLRLLFTICDKSLDQIEMCIEEEKGETNGKL
jgi:hypothetical protein